MGGAERHGARGSETIPWSLAVVSGADLVPRWCQATRSRAQVSLTKHIKTYQNINIKNRRDLGGFWGQGKTAEHPEVTTQTGDGSTIKFGKERLDVAI